MIILASRCTQCVCHKSDLTRLACCECHGKDPQCSAIEKQTRQCHFSTSTSLSLIPASQPIQQLAPWQLYVAMSLYSLPITLCTLPNAACLTLAQQGVARCVWQFICCSETSYASCVKPSALSFSMSTIHLCSMVPKLT